MVDIMTLLQQSANENKNFADRLRDERMAKAKAIDAFTAQVTPNDPYRSNGVQLDPTMISDSKLRFLGAVGDVTSMGADEVAARNSYQDALYRMLEGSGGVSIADQLKAKEAGYEIIDGQLVPVEGQVDQAKLDVTRLADSILGANTKPLTGDIRWGGVPLFNRLDVSNTQGQIDELMGILQLENIEKLKGQGTITDAERQILRDSISKINSLRDKNGRIKMEDKDFRDEITRIRNVFGDGSEYTPNYDEDAVIDSVLGGK